MAFASVTGTDSAGGGSLIAGNNLKLTFQGLPLAVVGDLVSSHPSTPPPGNDNGATVAAGSLKMTAGGLAVARLGDAATCGHTCTGSSTIDVAS